MSFVKVKTTNMYLENERATEIIKRYGSEMTYVLAPLKSKAKTNLKCKW